jgi:hypothetical protein
VLIDDILRNLNCILLNGVTAKLNKDCSMNNFTKTILMATFGVVMAAPVLAKGVLYDCQITQRDKKAGWIASQIVVIVPETGQPSVVDGLILHFEGKPISARIKDRGPELVVKWSLQSAKDSSGRKLTNLGYTARILKENNSVRVTGKPIGAPQTWKGAGKCTLRDENSLPKNLRG